GWKLSRRVLVRGQDAREVEDMRWAVAEYERLKTRFAPEPGQGARYPFNGVHFDRRRIGLSTAMVAPTTLDAPPRVTIVTRTHGDYPFLSDCLACVRQQTHAEVEHIVVEDDAKPGSLAQRLCERAGDVRYLPLAKVGRSEAGNAGAAAATGEFLIWLDQDDLVFHDHVERLVAGLASDPGAGGAYSLSWEAMARTRDGVRQTRTLAGPVGLGEVMNPDRIRSANGLPIQSVMVRRTLFETLGGFDPEEDLHEDWALWRRYTQRERFVAVPALTSIYITPGSLRQRIRRQLGLRKAM
ncbi:MAG: glycosyltransferase family A protein, partial [Litorimonas sp.]